MDLLKDARKKEWFWLENDLVDREDLSVYEKMAYMVMARYSDDESSCFPSLSLISKKMGCGITTVKKTINSLEEKNLIIKVHRKVKNKKENDTNVYYIMSLKGKSSGDIGHEATDGRSPYDQQVGREATSKKTYNKKTYIKSNTTPQNEPKTDYLDLSFLDLDIEKVKLTKDEYDKLISKFGKKYIHDKIVSLENYIINGKGSRYKSHYRALLTWGNGDASKGIVPEVTKTKNPLSGFKEL
ncbi:TPA: helix-turn-helix domain-containing protein [Clostridioides difficile]|uniref:helix-turn-helix domain-containing protein n=1 Tax=Clostridioides difficile TaxID=1496 RepID=UPI00038CD7DC|nr:helix-turn-helix domain-containing protein [Clostridioides difficile]EAA0010479.1 helix-turn-helix domain-containing protein [Clostridioides difficile]EGT3779628.1 helix-turn-helix domain-containing protein [Clostridioides difficile]EGT3820349.1 helix-turn-helix domain-containing protein [Clostridioides difficile]EGT4615795.1 helix-turn-helix domain-containing protein [Clostridioides difficile]EGT4644888.1 helix-turn-helix domain-containing protein [Clostridioides difficile]